MSAILHYENRDSFYASYIHVRGMILVGLSGNEIFYIYTDKGSIRRILSMLSDSDGIEVGFSVEITERLSVMAANYSMISMRPDGRLLGEKELASARHQIHDEELIAVAKEVFAEFKALLGEMQWS
jgi:hypothetical protein